MNLETMFIFELVLVALVLLVMVGTLLYLAMEHRRLRRETRQQVGTADIPVGPATDEPTRFCLRTASSTTGLCHWDCAADLSPSS